MKLKIILSVFLLLSLNVFSADYYKCKTEKSYGVSDSGTLKEKWYKGAPFTIDRATGEYRSFALNANFEVIDKGDKDTSFRAIYNGGWRHYPYMLIVVEFSDSSKKPYIFTSGASDGMVSTGLCEKF
jgi:hypothetical protein